MTTSPAWDVQQRIWLHACKLLTTSWDDVDRLYHERFRSLFARSAPRSKNAVMAQYASPERRKPCWQGLCQTLEWYMSEDPALISEIRNLATRLGVRLSAEDTALLGRIGKRQRQKEDDMQQTDRVSRESIVVAEAAPRTKRTHVPTPILSLATPARQSSVTQAPSNLTQPLPDALAPAFDIELLLASDRAQLSPSERLYLGRNGPQPDFEPMTQEVAHPRLPSILYRVYDITDSHAINSTTGGFIAGQFAASHGRVPPPEPCTSERLLFDIENHVNGRKIRSPLISTASSLQWVLRKALKLDAGGLKRDVAGIEQIRDIHVVLLDSYAVRGDDGHGYYHMAPYFSWLKKRYLLDPNAWKYGGKYEFLIWGRIPRQAVIADFRISDLQKLCEINPRLGQLLRLDMLNGPGHNDQILDRLKLNSPAFDQETISAMAMFIHSLTQFSPEAITSSPSQIAQLISDICSAWYIRPREALSREQWANSAEQFATALETHHGKQISGNTRYSIKHAFLCGMTSSFGKVNWQMSDKGRTYMRNRAREYGMEDPTAMLASEGDQIIALISSFRHTEVTASSARSRPAQPRPRVQQQAAQIVTPVSTAKRPRLALQTLALQRERSTSPPPTPTPAARTSRRRATGVVVYRSQEGIDSDEHSEYEPEDE